MITWSLPRGVKGGKEGGVNNGRGFVHMHGNWRTWLSLAVHFPSPLYPIEAMDGQRSLFALLPRIGY